MKEIIVRKTKSGKKTAMPMMVKHIVKNVRMQEQDLSEDFPVAHKAERELGSLKRKVSPELIEMLKMQLMAFRGDMQQEMATDLVIFAHDHLAYTTGCPSADMVLDVCYSWIAHEQGLLKVNFSDYQDEAGV